VHKQETHQEMR